MITAYSEISKAVQAIKFGAVDFIEKPWRNEKIVSTVQSAYLLVKAQQKLDEETQARNAVSDLLDRPHSEIIGVSDLVLDLIRTVEKIAPTNAHVLIMGENGVGKEVFARAIHRLSARKEEVFMSVDLGAIPESLFESELFGHRKGAFTGANENRMGKFQLANRGTLFLDEIGNIPLSLQSKLLQVLQTHSINPVRGDKPENLDLRIICATNKSLTHLISQGKFREDLYFRINTLTLEIPPLRERSEDIPVLLDHFLKIYCNKYNKPEPKISKELQKALQQYNWPGNVREFQHLIERAVILSEGARLQSSDFHFSNIGRNPREGVITLNLEENEKHLIMKALRKFNGNVSRASNVLGLTRSALYRRMEKFQIDLEDIS